MGVKRLKRKELEHELAQRAHISDFRAGICLQALEDIIFEAIANNDMLVFKYFKIGGIILPPRKTTGYSSLKYGDYLPARSGYPVVVFSPHALETVDIPAEEYFKDHPNCWTSEFRQSLLRRIYYHSYGLNTRLRDTMKYIVKTREIIDRQDAKFRITLSKLKSEDDKEKWGVIMDDIINTERRRTFYLGLKLDRAVARKMWLRDDYWEWNEKKLYGKWPNNDDFINYLNWKYAQKGEQDISIWEKERLNDKAYLENVMPFEQVYTETEKYIPELMESGFFYTRKGETAVDTENAEVTLRRREILEKIKKLNINEDEIQKALAAGLEPDELYLNLVMSKDAEGEEESEDTTYFDEQLGNIDDNESIDFSED